MKEIEIKIKVKDLGSIVKKLEELGCKISSPIFQNDIIFEKPGESSSDRNVLRIRRSGSECLFTLKKNVSDELDCIEKELAISDGEMMEEIVLMLGYREMVRVKKARRKCRYEEMEICLDQVDGLGDFIEVEKFSDEDAEAVREGLLKFVSSIGVDLSGRVLKGYDTMLKQI